MPRNKIEMCKVAKIIKNCPVIGWGIVLVEVRVRHYTTQKILNLKTLDILISKIYTSNSKLFSEILLIQIA